MALASKAACSTSFHLVWRFTAISSGVSRETRITSFLFYRILPDSTQLFKPNVAGLFPKWQHDLVASNRETQDSPPHISRRQDRAEEVIDRSRCTDGSLRFAVQRLGPEAAVPVPL